MSAPTATGSLALVRQHTINETGAAPTAATLKGLAIHTAFDAGQVGPDYTYGWGVLDAAAATSFVSDTEVAAATDFIYENTYAGSEYTLNVMGGIGQMKATLIWQDVAGPGQNSNLDVSILDAPGNALVNDLDLWITDTLGNTYYPWNLNPAVPASAAFRTSLNHRDNEEQVLIDVPAAGRYMVHVSGGAFMQNYSLLLSGVEAVPEPAGCVLSSLAFVAISIHGRRRKLR
jgi:hypothetical protein